MVLLENYLNQTLALLTQQIKLKKDNYIPNKIFNLQSVRPYMPPLSPRLRRNPQKYSPKRRKSSIKLPINRYRTQTVYCIQQGTVVQIFTYFNSGN